MTLGKIIILAVLQGVTEFLPVSSSGHLLIAQKFFDFSGVPLAFDVLLHLGSLIAILFFFRIEIKNLITGKDIDGNYKEKERKKIFFLVILASLPVVVSGLFFKENLPLFFESLGVLGVCFLISAALLFSTKLFDKKRGKKFAEISVFDALFVGLVQALAILPGVSRSGATIAAGIWSGFSLVAAFVFSFLLAIPAIAGAFLLELPKVAEQSGGWQFGLIGLFVSSLASFFSLKLLKNLLEKEKLFWLGGYCLLVGLGLLFFG
ncbi:MAG: Undecaprenyl-diphosphatase [Microgenomates group bacterium ADurb.Bin219]|nr:MAG: Undecaprenyl-diphosphatase [Microgenomates group bacterium ADurb.Bin219]HNP89478.1 undecaprenyl-diphosphate phosphatase [Candidatus Woesebacteria bacterium]